MRIQHLKKLNEDKYEITSPDCPDCGLAGMTATIDGAQLYGVNQGILMIQDILPDLPNYERERFISGMCDPCYSSIWAE
jgi:hypothetical protein